MNDYYGNFPDNDYRYYLQHGTKGKHWEWAKEKVKYIAKQITDSGAVRYIYELPSKAKKAVHDLNTKHIQKKKENEYKKTDEYKEKMAKAENLLDRYLWRNKTKSKSQEKALLGEGKAVKNAITLLRPLQKAYRAWKVSRRIKKADKQREKEAKKLEKANKRFERKQAINRLLTPLDNILKYSKRKRNSKAVAERIASAVYKNTNMSYADALENKRRSGVSSTKSGASGSIHGGSGRKFFSPVVKS